MPVSTQVPVKHTSTSAIDVERRAIQVVAGQKIIYIQGQGYVSNRRFASYSSRSAMVYVKHWKEFRAQALDVYARAPGRVGIHRAIKSDADTIPAQGTAQDTDAHGEDYRQPRGASPD